MNRTPNTFNVTILGALAACVTAPVAYAQSGPAFHDTFDWLDRGRWYISDGWVNGDHQNCQWEHDRVQIEDPGMTLSLTSDRGGDQDRTCAEVQSVDRFGFGTFEVRMRAPYVSGANANFFTFIGAPQRRPHDEIDFEFLGRAGPALQTNFYADGDGQHERVDEMEDDGQFHTYAFIWEPERIRWFIDGKLIRTETGADLPDDPQKLYFSVWSTGTLTDWMGKLDDARLPVRLEVDWVAVTPLGMDCQFDASVLCADGVDLPR